MGARVSYIDAGDTQFYLLNIPRLDFFILDSILVIEAEEGPVISLTRLKKRFEAKHKSCPSPALWSQATKRLSQRGILYVLRSGTLALQISSPQVRAQLKILFLELKKTEEMIQRATEMKQKFNGEGGAV